MRADSASTLSKVIFAFTSSFLTRLGLPRKKYFIYFVPPGYKPNTVSSHTGHDAICIIGNLIYFFLFFLTWASWTMKRNIILVVRILWKHPCEIFRATCEQRAAQPGGKTCLRLHRWNMQSNQCELFVLFCHFPNLLSFSSFSYFMVSVLICCIDKWKYDIGTKCQPISSHLLAFLWSNLHLSFTSGRGTL